MTAPMPWDREPARVEWTTEAGLSARVERTQMGHLCGYVQVPAGHPLHGVGYQEKSGALAMALERRKAQPIGERPAFSIMLGLLSGKLDPTPDTCLHVHGGITWAETYPGGLDERPRTGEWWFGFDCAHAGDLSPGSASVRRAIGGAMLDGEYRDGAFVRAECESLASQLVEIQREAQS